MSSNKIYSKYFIKDSRGYNIIRKFYDRYKDEFQTIAFNSFDSLIKHITININTIELPKETRNEEAYIIGFIKVQCRMLVDQILKLNSSGNGRDEAGNSFFKIREAFKRINEFKLRLDPKELEIFNSLIDEESKEELTEEGINTSAYDSIVKKLRSRFNSYLKELGYKYESFFPEKKIEP